MGSFWRVGHQHTYIDLASLLTVSGVVFVEKLC
jgi:hypothetical protein